MNSERQSVDCDEIGMPYMVSFINQASMFNYLRNDL